MKRLTIASTLLALLAACGGEQPDPSSDRSTEPAQVGPRLEATLTGGVRDEQGRLHLDIPFRGMLPLHLRVTNTGDAPVQVVQSSFPFFYFHKLDIVRLGENGGRTPLKPNFALSPTEDMKPPMKEYVTLLPGEHMERPLDILIREAYAIETLHSDIFGSRDRLLDQGYGKLREPGVYEVTGRYSVDPTFLDGKPHDTFSDVLGRDETIPLWTGGEVTTPPLRIVIVGGR